MSGNDPGRGGAGDDPTLPPRGANDLPQFTPPGYDALGQAPTVVPATSADLGPTMPPASAPPPSGINVARTMPMVDGMAPTVVPDATSAPTMGPEPVDPGNAPTYMGAGSQIARPASSDGFSKAAPNEQTAIITPAPPGSSAPTPPPGRQVGSVISGAPAAYPKSAAPAAAPRTRGTGTDASSVDLSGQRVGGYHVTKMLGHGGMGAVALARQLSLDRDVALKILPGKFAANPDFLMRFTREALSAARLAHHNVIQVYDIGSHDGVHYISMEFVRGQDLGSIVRKEGKLEPDDAASYVLQAARGLKYAHDHGIIHRDIKPDNIMVNEQGVVKIADMGLAKIVNEVERSMLPTDIEENEALAQAAGNLTMASVAMGTPAYMAPEQGRDATSVDPRADQYSLGCTLYYLITGKAPYSGKTAMEIISKHQMEPLTPIEAHVKHVPSTLSGILRRMLAKDPQDRYATLRDVIQELEAYLGIESDKGAYTPREQHMQVLEREQAAFYAAPALAKRKWAAPIFFGVMALLIVSFIAAKSFALAGGAIGLAIIAPLAVFILNGLATKSFFFRRVRSVLFSMTFKGWIAVVANAVLILLVLYFVGWLISWVVFAVLGLGLAIGYEMAVARPLRKQRTESLDKTNEMLKQLRVRGVSEDQLHDFVYRYSGVNWEEFYEALFGYEEMILARGKWAKAEKVKPRRKFATWRDPVMRSMDALEEARREEREKKQLAKAEKDRLKAQGVSEEEASKKAEEVAAKVVQELEPTLIIPAQSYEQYPRLTSKKRGGGDSTLLNPIYRVTRFLIGAGATALYAAFIFAPGVFSNLPGFLQTMFKQAHHPGTIFNVKMQILTLNWLGLIAAVCLLLSAFSRKVIFPALCLIGVLLVAAGSPLAGYLADPNFTPLRALLAGTLLAIIGFVMPILLRMFGGR